MRMKLVRIGNSRGIRLPKAMIHRYGLDEGVELEMRNDHIIVRAARRKPRQGWDEAFARMHAAGDDRLLDAGQVHKATAWEQSEWRW